MSPKFAFSGSPKSITHSVLSRMPIEVRNAHFIKLGRQGIWEQECIRDGIIRFGYDETPQELAENGQWEALKDAMRGTWSRDEGALTRHVAQVRKFYEADERDVFFTFVGGRMHWVRATGPIERYENGQHWRRTVDGWSDQSESGQPLNEDRLSGHLTKIQMFRGTICDPQPRQLEYFIRKLNDEDLPQITRAIEAEQALHAAVLELIRLLTWQDFELLVDLIFSGSGWRRIGQVGKTQRTVDLELELPTTGERAFVQVKSQTNNAQLQDYVRRYNEAGAYDRMFYVWHTGRVGEDQELDGVTLVGPETVATLVLEAGLSSWLREKVS